MQPVLNFINGSFVEAASQRTIDDVNPATGEGITTIPRSGAEDVQAAVDAALAATPAWASTPLEERIAWLHKIADALEEQAETIAQLESLDTGKPITLARNVDAARSVANFRFFADFVLQQPQQTFSDHGAINYVQRSPVGCVGLITPWNLPLYLLSWKVAPALLMGNTIVAKPSELTPLTANLLAQTMQTVGLPSGVFNVVHGYGPDVGQAIVEHDDIRGISFTGGTATGKIVAATAAPMFKKLSLELGGKNATVLLDDAPLDEIMQGVVRASFTNSGQVCLCGSRILVHASIYDDFLEKFVHAVERIQVGDPSNEATVMGSVISQDHKTKVESYIQLGVEEGGVVLTGGLSKTAPVENVSKHGAFLRPTVLAGLPATSRTATEEIFGPVVTVHAFETEDEAVEMANGTPYGLAGSVWTADIERGHRFAERMDTGIVWVNTWLNRDLRTPFGGVKQSGVGREGGAWSLNFFSELTNICVQQP
ncbi:MAG: 2-hydroxymuconic semialdehyde dehydrogenase [Euryarchaeota archaeon]|nr:2-hydroxymuconic semialdehyde dehydrogenase [Euryarchaeota archaeon]